MKNLKYSLLAIGMLLVGWSGGNAQYYDVSTCEELDLKPVEQVRSKSGEVSGNDRSIISIYLDGDEETGIGGLGCWVHHHRNGRDFVVTPFGWGRKPDSDRMELIRLAMAAITDARAKYVDYGSLNADLYYLFDDISRPDAEGEKFWLYDTDQCWMRSGVPSIRGRSPDQKKQIFAHEIGHCFNEENAPNMANHWNGIDSWMDESVAEFLSSEVYKQVDLEHQFSVAYNFDVTFTAQPYNAYVLWYYYVKQKGDHSLVSLMRELANRDTQAERFAYLQGIGFDRIFHNFLFDWTKNDIMDSGGHKKIPRMENNIDETFVLDPSETVLDLPEKIIPAQRGYYWVQIPAGYDLKIKPAKGTDLPFYQSLFLDDDTIRNWKEEKYVQGDCARDRVILVMISHLNTTHELDLSMEYELEERIFCCVAGARVSENPTSDNLNGTFTFDYYIKSKVAGTTDGKVDEFHLNYYVNSLDGSMLMPPSFLFDNFGQDEDNGMKVHAVIWYPNGQLVGYVYDTNFGQKRAITIDLNQTRNQIMGIQAMNAAELVRMGPRSGISPSSLPSGSQWQGQSHGIAINMPERSDPSQINKFSAYLSNDNTSITSPLPQFGFLVGYIRDATNRNKKLVYQKVELPGGDFYEGHLQSIEKMCAQFDGAGYKKMTIGASTGAIASMTETERQAFADSQNEMHVQLMMMLNDLERCRGDAQCEAEVQKRMMELERQIQDAVFDLPENSENRGNAASEFQAELRAIRDEMHRLQETILDQEIRCERLRRLGGARLAAESCERQLEEYKNQMEQLNCRLARLQGVDDMFGDCPQ